MFSEHSPYSGSLASFCSIGMSHEQITLETIPGILPVTSLGNADSEILIELSEKWAGVEERCEL